MEQKNLKISNPKVKSFYDGVLAHMRKQYKDVERIDAVHINNRGKIFSAEWVDSKGVFNFCGGFVIDTVKIVRFIHV